jgi:Mg2+-importing ATPase
VAVGLTPQLLPAIVTVSLSTGARRMAEHAVLVRRLVSIEDLGDTEILFTDKTGTLTLGEIVLEEVVAPDGMSAPKVLLDAALASTGTSLLDTAVLAEVGAPPPGRIVHSVPFDYERRSSSVVVEALDGTRRLLCKGAPEVLIARCVNVPAAAQTTLDGLLDDGLRVLAVAGRPVEGDDHDEAGISLLGFLGFSDPPKSDAAAAVARLARLGVELKVLTGDHERSAAGVCERLGVPVKGAARGDDVESLDGPVLAELIARTTVFARVTPEQKARIVAAAQHPGTDVAFLGDGVNDALALRQADVGISVDTAMDVAREAADVVLLEKSLDVLADGVVEGRRIFANTMKYILMGTSSNFGNMFSAAAASLFLSFLPMLPKQILLNNLLYDGSEMTIPTDNVDEELMRRPAHWDIGFIRRFMLFFGPISSLYDFMTFGVMLWVFDAGPELFRTGWFVESLCTQALVIFVIRTRRIPFFHSRPSRPLLLATLAVAAVAVAIPYSPLAAPLGFVAPPAPFLGILAVMVVTYLGLVETGKWVFYRRFAHLQ